MQVYLPDLDYCGYSKGPCAESYRVTHLGDIYPSLFILQSQLQAISTQTRMYIV